MGEKRDREVHRVLREVFPRGGDRWKIVDWRQYFGDVKDFISRSGTKIISVIVNYYNITVIKIMFSLETRFCLFIRILISRILI